MGKGWSGSSRKQARQQQREQKDCKQPAAKNARAEKQNLGGKHERNQRDSYQLKAPPISAQRQHKALYGAVRCVATRADVKVRVASWWQPAPRSLAGS